MKKTKNPKKYYMWTDNHGNNVNVDFKTDDNKPNVIINPMTGEISKKVDLTAFDNVIFPNITELKLNVYFNQNSINGTLPSPDSVLTIVNNFKDKGVQTFASSDGVAQCTGSTSCIACISDAMAKIGKDVCFKLTYSGVTGKGGYTLSSFGSVDASDVLTPITIGSTQISYTGGLQFPYTSTQTTLWGSSYTGKQVGTVLSHSSKLAGAECSC